MIPVYPGFLLDLIKDPVANQGQDMDMRRVLATCMLPKGDPEAMFCAEDITDLCWDKNQDPDTYRRNKSCIAATARYQQAKCNIHPRNMASNGKLKKMGRRGKPASMWFASDWHSFLDQVLFNRAARILRIVNELDQAYRASGRVVAFFYDLCEKEDWIFPVDFTHIHEDDWPRRVQPLSEDENRGQPLPDDLHRTRYNVHIAATKMALRDGVLPPLHNESDPIPQHQPEAEALKNPSEEEPLEPIWEAEPDGRQGPVDRAESVALVPIIRTEETTATRKTKQSSWQGIPLKKVLMGIAAILTTSLLLWHFIDSQEPPPPKKVEIPDISTPMIHTIQDDD